jgi:hypothetical protein
MKKTAASLLIFLFLLSCAANRIETNKSVYQQAREAQETGDDLKATLYWKELLARSEKELASGSNVSTNSFMRASALFELGRWEDGFSALKDVHPEALSEEEMWIYPLYTVLMGDYYSQKKMTSVADDFYQSVLKKSSLKMSPVYMLALERMVNNSILRINSEARTRPDPEAWKSKQYQDLQSDVQKVILESPGNGVPHFLMGDLLAKTGRTDDSMQHLIASLDLGLPTHDLKQDAEYELAGQLSVHGASEEWKSAFLESAIRWWGSPTASSVFQAGENSVKWAKESGLVVDATLQPDVMIRYVAIKRQDGLRIVVWDRNAGSSSP